MTKKKETKKKLTLKEKKFTAEYLKTGNATQAAKNAGYSKKCAKEIGYEILTKPHISSVVESAAEKLGITPEYVLGNLKEIAEFNSSKFTRYDKFGNEKTAMIDPSVSAKANELLGKHLSLFTDTVEITGKDGKDLIPEESLEKTAKRIALLLASV